MHPSLKCCSVADGLVRSSLVSLLHPRSSGELVRVCRVQWEAACFLETKKPIAESCRHSV